MCVCVCLGRPYCLLNSNKRVYILHHDFICLCHQPLCSAHMPVNNPPTLSHTHISREKKCFCYDLCMYLLEMGLLYVFQRLTCWIKVCTLHCSFQLIIGKEEEVGAEEPGQSTTRRVSSQMRSSARRKTQRRMNPTIIKTTLHVYFIYPKKSLSSHPFEPLVRRFEERLKTLTERPLPSSE